MTRIWEDGGIRLGNRASRGHASLYNASLTVDSLQFAQNGVWEDVQTLFPNRFDDLYRLSAWLNQAARDVAVEALFVTPEDELKGFLGIRVHDAPSAERTLMWLRLAILLASEAVRPFDQLLDLSLTMLGFPSTLPNTAPTFEMGVFNFWQSATPLLSGHDPHSLFHNLCLWDKSPRLDSQLFVG